MEPRSDRRRHRSHRERSSIAPFRCLHRAGGRRGSSRREFLGGVHGLARQITLLYDRLIRIQPSPVVELNRAVAIAMYKGPEQGLCLIDDLLTREELDNYSLAYSARADLCRRLGRLPEARASYEKALSLARQEPERCFLAGRLEELKEKTGDAVDFLSAPTTIG